MSQPTKITESELAELKMLSERYQETIRQLGILQVEKMELDRMVTDFVEKEKKLKDAWINLQSLDRSAMDKIIKKYGVGNLNLTDGTFTPATE